MKTYKIQVKYSFDAEFVIHGESEEEISKVLMTKVKTMSGSINTFSLQIRDWSMTTKPVETKIIKILEL